MKLHTIKRLKKNGIIKEGTKLQGNEIIIGKIKKIKENSLYEKVINIITNKNFIKETSIKSPDNLKCTAINIKYLKKNKKNSIIIYAIEKRELKLGDKLSGRHGNKGIVSKIIPIDEMPFTLEGIPIDVLLNPLGVPSRMNLGQIYECTLGLAGTYLNEKYEIKLFNQEAKPDISKNIIYNKLHQASRKSGREWIFNLNDPGKTFVIQGKTGKIFQEKINIGYAYILKLIHLVDDKINARLTGPYSSITKQPLKGKSKKGGQRVGEMEIWGLESYGVAYTIKELLTIKSDDVERRWMTLKKIIKGKNLPKTKFPESLKIFIIELQCLCLDIKIYISKLKKIF